MRLRKANPHRIMRIFKKEPFRTMEKVAQKSPIELGEILNEQRVLNTVSRMMETNSPICITVLFDYPLTVLNPRDYHNKDKRTDTAVLKAIKGLIKRLQKEYNGEGSVLATFLLLDAYRDLLYELSRTQIHEGFGYTLIEMGRIGINARIEYLSGKLDLQGIDDDRVLRKAEDYREEFDSSGLEMHVVKDMRRWADYGSEEYKRALLRYTIKRTETEVLSRLSELRGHILICPWVGSDLDSVLPRVYVDLPNLPNY